MSGKLTTRQVQTCGPGMKADGGGLHLEVEPNGTRRWWFIFTWHEPGRAKPRRPEMGLGTFPDISLAEARALAADARRLKRSGVNPIEARKAGANKLTAPTFGEIADELLKSKQAECRSARHVAQWRMTITEYAAPLRAMPVAEIDTAAILGVLKPLWLTRPETASRLRGRIEAVLDAAKARGLRSGENPAAWRGHLSHLLPKRQKLSRGHFAAMAYSDAPAFVSRLRECESLAALALEFCILTAARTGEVLGARWSEIDMEAKIWTIPAGRTKAGREHRVPLSDRALAILEKLAGTRIGEHIFPGPSGKKPLSAMAMLRVLRGLGVIDDTVHGFRSTFRDWAGNETHFPREVAEQALAHATGSAVEAAYRRSDAIEKRRALMQAWANYLEQDKRGNVVPLQPSAGNSAS